MNPYSSNARTEHFGDIPARTLGTGQPTLVVHGGPGMDHSYLTTALAPLASSNRRLIFYDQHFRASNGNSSGENVPQLVSDLHALVRSIRARYGRPHILAHSWGAYLVYSLLANTNSKDTFRLALVSPVGLTKQRFDDSATTLMARVPEGDLSRIEHLAESGRDLELMHLLFPFYLAQGHRDLSCPINYYNNRINEVLLDSLDDYDFTDVPAQAFESGLLVYGAEDIESPNGTRELHDRMQVHILPDAGHFSFLESPDAFQSLVLNWMLNAGNSR